MEPTSCAENSLEDMETAVSDNEESSTHNNNIAIDEFSEKKRSWYNEKDDQLYGHAVQSDGLLYEFMEHILKKDQTDEQQTHDQQTPYQQTHDQQTHDQQCNDQHNEQSNDQHDKQSNDQHDKQSGDQHDKQTPNQQEGQTDKLIATNSFGNTNILILTHTDKYFLYKKHSPAFNDRSIVGVSLFSMDSNGYQAGKIYRFLRQKLSPVEYERQKSGLIYRDKFMNDRNFNNLQASTETTRYNVALLPYFDYRNLIFEVASEIYNNNMFIVYHKFPLKLNYILRDLSDSLFNNFKTNVKFERLVDKNIKEIFISQNCLYRENHNNVTCEICISQAYFNHFIVNNNKPIM